MIIGMVTFMSAFGIVMNGQTTQFVSVYGQTWLLNFIVALPYQLLIVGPISRFMLSRMRPALAQ